MTLPPEHPRDPVGWSGLIAFAFLALGLIRLGIPTHTFFDEVHYVPAARTLLELSHAVNREHPMVGKEIIAAGIALFGDNPHGWRILPLLAGAIALFAFMRALWFATGRRFAVLGGGVLLATNFALFVQSRIAMLDIFMIASAMLALWMCAAALREAETARWRLAIAGVSLGLAMGAKWNAIPIAVLPGLAFAAIRLRSAGMGFLTARRGWPVPGMTLIEAALWLGLLPLATYALTFLPYLFYAKGSIGPGGLFELHVKMLELQDSVVKPHNYQSRWHDWVLDWRPIWYLYQNTDGAQRGVIMLGNPLTMWGGLLALLWCGWMGVARRNWAALAVAVLYLASIGMWVVAPKPVQFYFHYLLPGIFVTAALALALDWAWQAGWKKSALLVVAASCALFAYFYPVLSAAELSGKYAFLQWTWLESWR